MRAHTHTIWSAGESEKFKIQYGAIYIEILCGTTGTWSDYSGKLFATSGGRSGIAWKSPANTPKTERRDFVAFRKRLGAILLLGGQIVGGFYLLIYLFIFYWFMCVCLLILPRLSIAGQTDGRSDGGRNCSFASEKKLAFNCLIK